MNQFNQFQRPVRSTLDWIMVQTIDQVESVAVQPNTKAWIMVQNEPIFALRTADAMGLTITEYYRFEKYEPNPAPEYVTKAELMAMIEELRGKEHESTISESAE